MSTTADQLREEVRRHYAESARGERGASRSCERLRCGGEETFFGEALYDAEQRGELPEAAAQASLGCGNPTAVADLHEGETVLDLGSGGGIDVILWRGVGETGLAFGLDMTDEMLALARANAAEAGVRNAIFLKGVIEDVPLPAASVDVVISNCVVNLSTDKAAVLAEIARACRSPGADRDQRRRRRGPALPDERGRARRLRRLHRGRSRRASTRARGRRLREHQCRLHARGRGRHARRDREGGPGQPARRALPVVATERAGCC